MTRRLTATVALLVGVPALFGMLALVLISDDSSAGPNASKTYVMPHFMEKKGTAGNTKFTFDTTVYMTYMTGVTPGGGAGAGVDLFLYKDNGDILRSGTSNNVCNPCTITLSDTKRKQSVRIDDLITKKGGFVNNKVVTGYGIIVVTGDIDNVNLQGFVVNAHTSPFDLSVFGFEPQPIVGAP